jgi:sortase A
VTVLTDTSADPSRQPRGTEGVADPTDAAAPRGGPTPAAPRDLPRVSPAGAIRWTAVGVLVLLVAGIAVVYGLGPLTHQRDQRHLMRSYRTALDHAAAEVNTFEGVQPATSPPATASPVGVLEIGRLGLQEVVVEGVGPAETALGPGHVPGTAGLGQPGNAAVVGRRSGFGGVFAHLDHLRRGDQIVVTTTEGQTVYTVRSVHTGAVTDTIYDPSAGNRLTLVTSASALPWSSARAVLVVATMSSPPFAPTPEQSRSASQDGRSGDGSSGAPLALALLALVAVLAAAVALYRHASARVAYLVSTAPLIVFSILAAEAASRLLPAWL